MFSHCSEYKQSAYPILLFQVRVMEMAMETHWVISMGKQMDSSMVINSGLNSGLKKPKGLDSEMPKEMQRAMLMEI